MKNNLLSMLILMGFIAGYTTEGALAQSYETSSNKQLSAQVKSNKSPVIGFVQNSKPQAGCFFKTFKDAKNNRQRYIYAPGLDSEYLINIDGSDIVLNQVKTVDKANGSTTFFTSGNIRVRADMTSNKIQGIDNNLNLTITVTRGGRKSTIRGIGSCGC